MARLKTVEISSELRASLAAQAFAGFTLVEVPTGRDPRTLDPGADRLPAAVVHVKSTQVTARAIGGICLGHHSVAVWLLFDYADSDDLNLLKLAHGAELFDWLAANRAGTHYQVFTRDGDELPGLDYDPMEQQLYEAREHRVAVVRLDFIVRERESWAL